MTFRLPILIAAAATLVAAPAAHAATAPIAVEQHAASVSAYGDTLAWSSFDHGAYKLMIDRGGSVAAAPVAGSPAPFDVDLGTSRSGAPVAVYSRAGRLYSYDIAAGAEQRLDPGVGGRLSQPTIMAGRLAFVARKAGHDVIYLRKGAGAAKPIFSESHIRDVELSATRLAFVTTRGRIERLSVQTLNGRAHVVYTARSGGLNQADIVGPGFDASGKQLLWARRNVGSGSGNRFVRLDLATGKTTYALGTDKVFSVSWVDDAHGFATALTGTDDDPTRPGDGVSIATSGPLEFTAHA